MTVKRAHCELLIGQVKVVRATLRLFRFAPAQCFEAEQMAIRCCGLSVCKSVIYVFGILLGFEGLNLKHHEIIFSSSIIEHRFVSSAQ